jgi:membrane protein DedA with SNARE-associated domain
MDHIYVDLFNWVQAHGMAGVLLFMLIESAGVPFPTELGFITAQGLVSAGYSPYWEAYAYITVGHLIGSGISYQLGRAGHGALSRRFSHSRRMMRARDRMQGWYAKYGPVAIIFGRMVGQVRPWASFVAGMAQVPPVPFWIWTVVGSLGYTAAAMWVTKWGWQFWEAHPQLRVAMVATVVTVFYGAAAFGVIAKLIQRHRRRRKLAEEEI